MLCFLSEEAPSKYEMGGGVYDLGLFLHEFRKTFYKQRKILKIKKRGLYFVNGIELLKIVTTNV